MSVSMANICMDFFNQNLKEMKHTINSKKRFHSTDNVIGQSVGWFINQRSLL